LAEEQSAVNSGFLTYIGEHFHWRASLYAAMVIAMATLVGRIAARFVSVFEQSRKLNEEDYRKKSTKEYYASVQRRSGRWGYFFLAVMFVVIIPLCTTTDAQPWWKVARDLFVILMFYDFFYYLVHRFLFHDGGFMGGPLIWVHAIHHQQHNPCRMDSGFLHPIENGMGLGLYGASIFVLSRFMGSFHVITIAISWLTFIQINLHNHDLWAADKFPFRYMSYMSKMHHNHHAKFTGGNFATISLFYDWLFGTLDDGSGYKRVKKATRV
jgi:sterol desaturase/sphingolipid hydroxylase (fatty acid hydroxylase superfamily)